MEVQLDWWKSTEPVAQTNPDLVLGSSKDIRVKQNIGYIVCGVIFRGSKEDAQVLMIQEVDGTWYLPAGRMEAGETIEDGMKREVKEEAGIECQTLGLICVETVRPAWYRFSYLAKHSGGDVKTLAQSDKESLQASWFRVDHVISGRLGPEVRLRSRDVIRLVGLAMTRRFSADIADDGPAPCAAVIERPQVGLFARLVLVCEDKLLLRNDHFPLIEYALLQHLCSVVRAFLETISDSFHEPSSMKVVCVETRPIPAYENDGSCLSILIEIANLVIKRTTAEDGYQWLQLTSSQQLTDTVARWRNNYAVLYL